MHQIGSVDGVPSPLRPNIEVNQDDFEVACHYLRYYQRGLVGFAIVVALGAAAERFWPAGASFDDWFPWGRIVLAATAGAYVVVPYRRKTAAFYRHRIRPLFDLLSERR